MSPLLQKVSWYCFFYCFPQPMGYCADSSWTLFSLIFFSAVCHSPQHKNLDVILCSNYLLTYSIESKCARRDLRRKTKYQNFMWPSRDNTAYAVLRAAQRSVRVATRRTAQCEKIYERPRAVQRSVRSTTRRTAQRKKNYAVAVSG